MKTILLASFFIIGQAYADQAILQKVDANGGGDSDFVTELTFDKDVTSQGLIEFSKDYVQIDLKGENRLARREVIRVADTEFQSVILSQFSPDVVRARLMLKESGSAEKFKGRIAVETIGNLIRLRVMSAGSAQAMAAEAPSDTETDAAAAEVSAGSLLEKPATELLAGEMTKTALADSRPASEATALAPLTPSDANKSEAEIPVLTKATAQMTKSTGTMARLLVSLGVILLVAGGMILFSKQWAKRRSGLTQHHQIKVLTQYGLGPKKSLAIIRVAGESILIGVTDTNINMIKSLALMDEDLPIEVPTAFPQELAQNMIPVVDKLSISGAGPTMEIKKDQEDFSFGTVRDMVASRLREMRSL